MLAETSELDELDRKIVRCIQLSPRVPFREVADVCGVSEQTAARRYRRLVRDGVLRVTAVLRPSATGQSNWMVRLQVRPSGAESLALALAQRDDVSWVTLASGGAEVLCVLRSRTAEARDEMLMQKLPRTAPVLGMSAAMVMHRFVGVGVSPGDDWAELRGLLDDADEAAIAATAIAPPLHDGERVDLSPADLRLVGELVRDGRAATNRLAHASGMSEGRAARRLVALIEQGAAYIDVDVSAAALGLHTSASLWLTVSPDRIEQVGTALAAEREIAFAAAITGSANLVASLVCRDIAHLYRFVSERVGRIEGVRTLEVTPVLRHVKQAGALLDGDRLAVQ